MATRRMFSKEIFETDSFMMLTQMAKLSYFSLCLCADDDGYYAAPYDLLKRLECPFQAIEELIDSGFLFRKDNGVVIVRHWLWHNNIGPKNYTPSIYLSDDIGISDNGIYELIDGTDPNQLSLIDIYAKNPKNPGKPVAREDIYKIKNNLLLDLSDENILDDVEFEIHTESENGCFPKVDTTGKDREGKERIEREYIDVSLKHDTFDESQIEYSDDFLYGTCHNVNLLDGKLLEIYKTFVDAKELIDKVSLILENAKSKKRNHFAFVMKVGKEDGFLTWEQLDRIKTNKKIKEEELAERDRYIEEQDIREKMEELGLTSYEEYKKHQRECREKWGETIEARIGKVPWETK